MGGILVFGLYIIAFIGWVLNIISIAHAESISGMVLVRVAGVFIAPLGSILGFF